ncbi:MAG: hypothetical protein EPN89_19290 [Methylovulum sp.]|nr:MAG: hypothetical protein EPN89_19290 [Methylovulum sp.]
MARQNRRVGKLTWRRVSGGRTRERARVDGRPLQPRDGRREAPDRKLVVIRNADGGTRSVRDIVEVAGATRLYRVAPCWLPGWAS